LREPGVEHNTRYRGGHARAERDDFLELATIFVAAGKTEQQVFDSVEARLLQVGGFPRSDALEKLQGRLHHVIGGQ
jgi:hypothetical protein